MAINQYTADNNNAFANLVGTILGTVIVDKELNLGLADMLKKKKDTTTTPTPTPDPVQSSFTPTPTQTGEQPSRDLIGVIQMADDVNNAVKNPSSIAPAVHKSPKKKSALGAALLPKVNTNPVKTLTNPQDLGPQSAIPVTDAAPSSAMQRRAQAATQDPASKIMAGIKALDDPSIPDEAKAPIAEKLLTAKYIQMGKKGF